MIGHQDSYEFMQMAPRFRQWSERGFMPWANHECYCHRVIHLDPTYEYGYQPAMEPKEITWGDPKPASCMALCYEAIKQLHDDFTMEDIMFLVESSGYDKVTISSAASQLCIKLGYRRDRKTLIYKLSRPSPSDLIMSS